ncbi:MAG: hypothetical protein HUM72_12580 [Dolichospermum sp.]|nr:hypothetical protein [Dolichospermum sp.]
MNIKKALRFIIASEQTIELKLNLLTEIGLNSSNDDIFKATEEVKNELESEEEIQEIWRRILCSYKWN